MSTMSILVRVCILNSWACGLGLVVELSFTLGKVCEIVYGYLMVIRGLTSHRVVFNI